jgi:hypothetical protein
LYRLNDCPYSSKMAGLVLVDLAEEPWEHDAFVIPSGRVKLTILIHDKPKGVGYTVVGVKWVEVMETELYAVSDNDALSEGEEISCRVEAGTNGVLVARDVWIVAAPELVESRKERRG